MLFVQSVVQIAAECEGSTNKATLSFPQLVLSSIERSSGRRGELREKVVVISRWSDGPSPETLDIAYRFLIESECCRSGRGGCRLYVV